MKLHVLHRTRFSYQAPVRDSLNEVRLRPADTDHQCVHDFGVKITPHAQVKHQLDFYRNHVHRFEVLAPHQVLEVEANSVVTTSPAPDVHAAASVPLSQMVACSAVDFCYDFLQPSNYVATSGDAGTIAREVTADECYAWAAVLKVVKFIHDEFRYQPAVTNVHTKMDEVLRLRQGVCQDFAHVALGLCRALDIPARYVSGYLYNGPADQLKGAQASHAWLEVYLPQVGWVGVDPTNNIVVGERHVKIAVGRDYSDVSPMRGTYRGTGQRTLRVDVAVASAEGADRETSPVHPGGHFAE